MKVYHESNFKKGWFVGDFTPSIMKTGYFEVAVKRYKEDDYEEKHYHAIAKEITHIIYGTVIMNNNLYSEGDIVIIEPNEATDFKVLEDTCTLVIKVPCVKNDKYLGEKQ